MYRECKASDFEAIKELYRLHGWSAYLSDDKKLWRAFQTSLKMIGAFKEKQLIGFIRLVGDGEHVLLVQDLLVHPDFMRQGIAKNLLQRASEEYNDVRMFFVITDLDDEDAKAFYHKQNLTEFAQRSLLGLLR